MVIAQLIAKLSSFIFKKIFHRGGETWPGELALFFFPNILTKLAFSFSQIIFIVGTNGKTSTCKLIKEVLEKKGLVVITNSSGANLLNGIVASILIKQKLFGQKKYVGVFELDEYAFTKVSQSLKPDYIILLNLFRDQLDRYGEVNSILARWHKALLTLPKTKVILNISDPGLASLTKNLKKTQLEYYSIPALYLQSKGRVLGDYNNCFKCGQKLAYYGHFLSHLGDWYCKQCKNKLPTSFQFEPDILSQLKNLANYMVINAQAVYLLVKHFQVSEASFLSLLCKAQPAFGRGESISKKQVTYTFFLGKNPVSWTATMDYLKDRITSLDLLVFGLNNRVPDGHDVSWIWDIVIDQNYLTNKTKIVVYGDRAYDLVIRLKAVGIEVDKVTTFNEQLEKVIKSYRPKQVAILANYSAMLEARQQIVGRAVL